MSERNAKMKHQQDEIEFLNSMMKVKDRLILEFMISMTANKITIPPHVVEIVDQLYPGRMDALTKASQEIARNEYDKEKDSKEIKPLRLVETKIEKES